MHWQEGIDYTLFRYSSHPYMSKPATSFNLCVLMHNMHKLRTGTRWSVLGLGVRIQDDRLAAAKPRELRAIAEFRCFQEFATPPSADGHDLQDMTLIQWPEERFRGFSPASAATSLSQALGQQLFACKTQNPSLTSNLDTLLVFLTKRKSWRVDTTR